MRIFMLELKKLWNWRVLLLILAMGVLTWFAFLADALDSYESLKTHGIYGAYQTKMFELYGDTLEPEELADFNIPGKKAAITAEANAIIAAEPVFAENGIQNIEEYQAFQNRDIQNMSDDEFEEYDKTLSEMSSLLDGGEDGDLDAFYSSPGTRLQCLEALENHYIDYEDYLTTYLQNDQRLIAVEAAARIIDMDNGNLINYRLCSDFSLYSAVTAVFALVAVILLIAPLLAVDRFRRINLLQYSSSIGRRIFRIQYLAAIISALVLTALIVAAFYLPFLLFDAGKYWGAHIMSLSFGTGIQLFNITFGQYVLTLAGMTIMLCVGAACFAFVVARLSSGFVTLMIKMVPIGAALSAIAVLAINMAQNSNNVLFAMVFRGKLSYAEALVCCALLISSLMLSALLVRHERGVDVT